MLISCGDSQKRALLEVYDAFRRDCEVFGGADKVGLELGKLGDTVRHWCNPYYKAKPTFGDLIKFLLITGGAYTLGTIQKVTREALVAQVVDSRVAQREIQYLRNLIGKK